MSSRPRRAALACMALVVVLVSAVGGALGSLYGWLGVLGGFLVGLVAGFIVGRWWLADTERVVDPLDELRARLREDRRSQLGHGPALGQGPDRAPGP